jgi:undecaprenyl-diphosphatase
MPIYQVVLLAIVQGLTEFLPVSSTAHLYLTSWLLGWNTEGLDFDIMLHIGTLLSVLLYFFQAIGCRSSDRRLECASATTSN